MNRVEEGFITFPESEVWPFGFKVEVDPNMPKDEIHLVQNGKVIAKVTDVDLEKKEDYL